MSLYFYSISLYYTLFPGHLFSSLFSYKSNHHERYNFASIKFHSLLSFSGKKNKKKTECCLFLRNFLSAGWGKSNSSLGFICLIGESAMEKYFNGVGIRVGFYVFLVFAGPYVLFGTGKLEDYYSIDTAAPMEEREKEALYSGIQGFVGKWWNGSDLYPDPCGWTPIQVWYMYYYFGVSNSFLAWLESVFLFFLFLEIGGC